MTEKKVPFSKNGNLHTQNQGRRYSSHAQSHFLELEKAEFRDCLKLENIQFSDGGAKRVHFTRVSNGKKVSMSICDFQKVILTQGIWKGILPEMDYTFVQRARFWFCVPKEQNNSKSLESFVSSLDPSDLDNLIVACDKAAETIV